MSAGDGALARVVDQIHAVRTAAALALTGGGSGAIPLLLRRPGGSRTVLDAAVPYSPAAIAEYLGGKPRRAVSADTAAALARRAFQRALALRPDARTPVVGLGATAALTTDRARRGQDRAHVATFDGARAAAVRLTFDRSAAVRAAQETQVERAVIAALADAVGVQFDPALAPASETAPDADDLAAVRDGRQPWLTVYPDGRRRPGGLAPAALIPGSFDPLHQAHRGLRRAARRRCGDPAAYELSIANVDKPPLSAEVVRARLAQFAGYAPVILSRAPTFLEKARLFPGAVFAVGVDTARRIVDPVYYFSDPMPDALAELRALGARFLVAGRFEAGRFVELRDLDLPPEARGLFQPIPDSELRMDLSSTQLRTRAATGPHPSTP